MPVWISSDQENPFLVAQGPNPGEVVVRRAVDATLPLDGFQHDGADSVVHTPLEGIDIVEGNEVKAGQDGFEALLDLLLSGGRERGHGAAVEGLGGREDHVTPGLAAVAEVFAGQFNGGLVGLRSAVAEEGPVGEAVFHQGRRQFGLGDGVVEIAHVVELLHLRGQSRVDGRMGVAQVADSDAGHKIGIAAPLGVPEGGSAPLLDHQGKTLIGIGEDGVGGLSDRCTHGSLLLKGESVIDPTILPFRCPSP
jgi:hypothetical protein